MQHPVATAAIAQGGMTLRLLDERDRALYLALYTCPRVMRHIGAPLSEPDATAAFARTVAHNLRASPGHRTFAIDGPGGAAGIGALHRAGARAEIGLMLLPSKWDGRHSHRAMQALAAHAFDAMALQALDAVCRLGPNVRPCMRLVAPLGFVDAHAVRPGTRQWQLTRARWQRAADTH